MRRCEAAKRKAFPGAMPVGFARRHIVQVQRESYFVAEKSDGERRLLVCFEDGHFGKRACLVDRKCEVECIRLHSSALRHLPEGAILDGELVSDIGGGVSQFATTFFNAAWFAGIELVDFKAHSFYFSRYPPGREATINYPNVNLEIRNDTPYDILIDTDSNATSVTVTFWSTPYWDVQTVMGPCGCGGSFRITNERILTAPGGQPVTEEYTTTYSVPR